MKFGVYTLGILFTELSITVVEFVLNILSFMFARIGSCYIKFMTVHDSSKRGTKIHREK